MLEEHSDASQNETILTNKQITVSIICIMEIRLKNITETSEEKLHILTFTWPNRPLKSSTIFNLLLSSLSLSTATIIFGGRMLEGW